MCVLDYVAVLCGDYEAGSDAGWMLRFNNVCFRFCRCILR